MLTELEAAVERWPADEAAGAAGARARLAALLDQLGDAVAAVACAGADIEGWPAALVGLAATAAAGRRAAGRRLLLCLEVIQDGANEYQATTEQHVEVMVVSPALTSPLAAGGSTVRPAERLAGDTANNYGGFLKRSWRANDWLWGRIDAASRIAGILKIVDPTPLYIEIVQAEAPALCAAIAADLADGFNCPRGRLVFKGGNVPAAMPDTWGTLVAHLELKQDGNPPEIQFLLDLDLGKEVISDELGSDAGRKAVDSLLGTASRLLRTTTFLESLPKLAWRPLDWYIRRKARSYLR